MNGQKSFKDFLVNKSESVSSSAQGTFRPQLTSLIDVMTILLVFLIKSFSVEGQIVSAQQDIELPLSVSSNTPELLMTVDITKHSLLLDGEKILQLNDFAQSDSLFIQELYNAFEAVGYIGQSEIMIQSDKYVPYNIIKRVIYTCSRAGIQDFSVLVIRDE